MQVYSNHHWRHFVYSYDVPLRVRLTDFSYHIGEVEAARILEILETSGEVAAQAAWLSATVDTDAPFDGFIQYKGAWYHLDQFLSYQVADSPWQGYLADSFYSCVLLRVHEDGERYQVATFIR